MRAVVQRVKSAQVDIDGKTVGQISHGFLVLLGIGREDTMADVAYMAGKLAGLRIFEDEGGKMNRDILAAGGEMLVVSQFTLYGDARKGFRPSFSEAARPELAVPLYEALLADLRSRKVPVATGIFQADMQVKLINDGPVTIIIDSKREF